MKNKDLQKLTNLAVFNKGTGTVTISYEAYVLMHQDSIFLNLIRCSYMHGGTQDAMKQLLTTLADPMVGTGFEKAQPPMCDTEAIEHLYDLPADYIEKYILEVDEC